MFEQTPWNFKTLSRPWWTIFFVAFCEIIYSSKQSHKVWEKFHDTFYFAGITLTYLFNLVNTKVKTSFCMLSLQISMNVRVTQLTTATRKQTVITMTVHFAAHVEVVSLGTASATAVVCYLLSLTFIHRRGTILSPYLHNFLATGIDHVLWRGNYILITKW